MRSILKFRRTHPPAREPDRTTADPRVRAWAETVLEKGALAAIEKTLVAYGIDSALTEEEVLLAASPIRRAWHQDTAVTVLALLALCLAQMDGFSWWQAGPTVALVVVGLVLAVRSLGSAHSAGVERVLTHRSEKGSLQRLE